VLWRLDLLPVLADVIPFTGPLGRVPAARTGG